MHGVGRLKGIVKIVESDYLERARELHGWQGNRKTSPVQDKTNLMNVKVTLVSVGEDFFFFFEY